MGGAGGPVVGSGNGRRRNHRNNALIGVRIHHLADKYGYASRRGKVPTLLKKIGAPISDWEATPHDLGDWVEDAIAEQCN